MLSSTPAHAATTFTVNRTTDANDAKLSDTKCDSNMSKQGKQCTLRAAIEEANHTPNSVDNPDLINFNIGGTEPVKTIEVGSTGLGPLPWITRAVTINGYSQPGAQENTLAEGNNAVLNVQLDGTDTSKANISAGSLL